MAIGTVKWFNPTKGFGFIAPEGGDKDVFVHISAVQAAGMSSLEPDQKIQYELEDGKDGNTIYNSIGYFRIHRYSILLIIIELESIKRRSSC